MILLSLILWFLAAWGGADIAVRVRAYIVALRIRRKQEEWTRMRDAHYMKYPSHMTRQRGDNNDPQDAA